MSKRVLTRLRGVLIASALLAGTLVIPRSARADVICNEVQYTDCEFGCTYSYTWYLCSGGSGYLISKTLLGCVVE